MKKLKFQTKVIHAGQKSFKNMGSVINPIFQTSTFEFESVEQAMKIFLQGSEFPEEKNDYVYTRGSNPSQRALEKMMMNLEGGEDAISFSSGMAAITATALAILKNGDHSIVSDITYGETHYLFKKILNDLGIKTTFIDTSDLKNFNDNIKKNTKLIFIETPTNPLMKLSDINEISKIAQKNNIILVVDNTVMTPYFQNPLELGADLVVHSTTKYLNGHCDALGGVVIGNKKLISKIRQILYTTGGVLDPFAAWLTLRGIKTLTLRMDKHNENAQKIAEYLENHEKVVKVNYPGLRTHPQFGLAKKQMKGFSGILSFELKGGLEAGKKLLNNVKLSTLAVSLGGVETLIEHPASMTHAVIPKQERLARGISDGLVRLSVGIEDIDDLINDLKIALEKI